MVYVNSLRFNSTRFLMAKFLKPNCRFQLPFVSNNVRPNYKRKPLPQTIIFFLLPETSRRGAQPSSCSPLITECVNITGCAMKIHMVILKWPQMDRIRSCRTRCIVVQPLLYDE